MIREPHKMDEETRCKSMPPEYYTTAQNYGLKGCCKCSDILPFPRRKPELRQQPYMSYFWASLYIPRRPSFPICLLHHEQLVMSESGVRLTSINTNKVSHFQYKIQLFHQVPKLQHHQNFLLSSKIQIFEVSMQNKLFRMGFIIKT